MTRWREGNSGLGRRGGALLRALVLLAGLSGAATASAQPSTAAQAEALYQQGKKLMAEGKFAEACPKLEESQRLDPGGGTLLNLAVCHDKAGRIATAWAEYKEASVLARRDRRDDRRKLADERAAALEPKLPRVVVNVPATADLPELEVRLDGVIVGDASRGSPVPLDPGAHVIAASAPGRVPWEATIELAEGETEQVEVPALVEEAREEPPPAPAPAPAPPVAPAPAPAPAPEGWGAQRIAGVVVGGVGLAALGVGAVFGVRAMSLWGESNDRCPDDVCDARGAELSRDAQQAATVANIAVGAGAGVLALGVVLVLTGGPADPAPSGARPSIHVAAAPAAGGGVVSLGGAW